VTQDAQPARRLAPYAIASALGSACGLAVAACVSEAAMFGAGFAAASAALALPFIAWGAPRGTNALLGGFVGGFFVRMLLVAAGLLLPRTRGAGALDYAIAFFSVYAATQFVEVAYVFSSSRTRRAGA
jgi:hypothetical protein